MSENAPAAPVKSACPFKPGQKVVIRVPAKDDPKWAARWNPDPAVTKQEPTSFLGIPGAEKYHNVVATVASSPDDSDKPVTTNFPGLSAPARTCGPVTAVLLCPQRDHACHFSSAPCAHKKPEGLVHWSWPVECLEPFTPAPEDLQVGDWIEVNIPKHEESKYWIDEHYYYGHKAVDVHTKAMQVLGIEHVAQSGYNYDYQPVDVACVSYRGGVAGDYLPVEAVRKIAPRPELVKGQRVRVRSDLTGGEWEVYEQPHWVSLLDLWCVKLGSDGLSTIVNCADVHVVPECAWNVGDKVWLTAKTPWLAGVISNLRRGAERDGWHLNVGTQPGVHHHVFISDDAPKWPIEKREGIHEFKAGDLALIRLPDKSDPRWDSEKRDFFSIGGAKEFHNKVVRVRDGNPSGGFVQTHETRENCHGSGGCRHCIWPADCLEPFTPLPEGLGVGDWVYIKYPQRENSKHWNDDKNYYGRDLSFDNQPALVKDIKLDGVSLVNPNQTVYVDLVYAQRDDDQRWLPAEAIVKKIQKKPEIATGAYLKNKNPTFNHCVWKVTNGNAWWDNKIQNWLIEAQIMTYPHHEPTHVTLEGLELLEGCAERPAICDQINPGARISCQGTSLTWVAGSQPPALRVDDTGKRAVWQLETSTGGFITLSSEMVVLRPECNPFKLKAGDYVRYSSDSNYVWRLVEDPNESTGLVTAEPQPPENGNFSHLTVGGLVRIGGLPAKSFKVGDLVRFKGDHVFNAHSIVNGEPYLGVSSNGKDETSYYWMYPLVTAESKKPNGHGNGRHLELVPEEDQRPSKPTYNVGDYLVGDSLAAQGPSIYKVTLAENVCWSEADKCWKAYVCKVNGLALNPGLWLRACSLSKLDGVDERSPIHADLKPGAKVEDQDGYDWTVNETPKLVVQANRGVWMVKCRGGRGVCEVNGYINARELKLLPAVTIEPGQDVVLYDGHAFNTVYNVQSVDGQTAYCMSLDPRDNGMVKEFKVDRLSVVDVGAPPDFRPGDTVEWTDATAVNPSLVDSPPFPLRGNKAGKVAWNVRLKTLAGHAAGYGNTAFLQRRAFQVGDLVRGGSSTFKVVIVGSDMIVAEAVDSPLTWTLHVDASGRYSSLSLVKPARNVNSSLSLVKPARNVNAICSNPIETQETPMAIVSRDSESKPDTYSAAVSAVSKALDGNLGSDKLAAVKQAEENRHKEELARIAGKRATETARAKLEVERAKIEAQAHKDKAKSEAQRDQAQIAAVKASHGEIGLSSAWMSITGALAAGSTMGLVMHATSPGKALIYVLCMVILMVFLCMVKIQAKYCSRQ